MSKKFSNFAPEMKKVYQIPVTEILQLEADVTLLGTFPDSFHANPGGMPPIRDARPVF